MIRMATLGDELSEEEEEDLNYTVLKCTFSNFLCTP